MKRLNGLRLACLVLGFGFLYLPILSVIVYSFNESRLVTVWSGWSTKWYGALLENQQLLGAAWLSVKIGALTATLAVVLGTLAAYSLVRFKHLKGQAQFELSTAAPLVMPEIIIGLASLLLFVSMEKLFGWPAGRGQTTIVIAHTVFAMAYVTVVVRSRLAHVDSSIEEVALDLGARPVTVFFTITLPTIAPAIIAGWLLAFTLSVDDLVVASFTSGPGSTTLPMVVYSSVRLGVSPEINALATVMIALVSVLVVIAGLVLARSKEK